MSIGMGIMDKTVHTESSKLSNGNASVTDMQNINHNTDPTRRLKFKRRKVYAVRDFPPGCGTSTLRLRSKTETKTCENNNIEANEAKPLAKVEEESNLMDVEVKFEVEPRAEPVKEESHELKVVVAKEESQMMESTNDEIMVEPLEVKPISICLPQGDDNVISAPNPCKDLVMGSISGPRLKHIHGRKLSVVRDFPTKTGSKAVLNGKNMVRDMVAYGDKQTDTTKPNVTTAPKPIGRKMAKKRVAFHEPLKVREHGEGSKIKKTFQVGLPPSRPIGSTSGGGDSMRAKVKETLRLFHGACRKLIQEVEANPEKKGRKMRFDYEAAKILKAKGKYLNVGSQITGPVPGVEVGDEFQYRMELNILGIHKPSQGGIDYVKVGEDIFATSIVASGGYDDELDNSDVLIYTGQGGNVIKVNKKGKEIKDPEDQKLITGNLALANSVHKKNPVRVIRGNKKAALESASEARGGNYVYDGLYVVEDYWQETGTHGMLVFRFKLRRLPGQPELSWKIVKKNTKLKHREGLCKLDISEGRERLPISAVNEIDDEKPPSFIYTAKMIYPNWCRPVPPKSCGCTKRCTEALNCVCVAKNGGEIPYNYDGAVVSAKPLIYECGPLCKCPPSCYLRVAQRGIKFQLEIFKTESRGWGVRSINSISSGSFICEYVGELLEDREAEIRVGNDEYLFDIGNKYDNSLAEGMSKIMPGARVVEEEDDEGSSGFTIDAAKKGNIGRFINHSCSPNLYAQNILYDHEDKRIPHVMFFAMDNIPPLQELCYHYNYMIDQVRDTQGNIKKKNCYCGASDCTGRLY